MTQRITEKMLQARIDYLNRITGSPESPYAPGEDGKMKAQIGNYHLSHAYGGVCVHRMSNEHGGINTPIISYHAPKRECFDALGAYIDGYEACKRGE